MLGTAALLSLLVLTTQLADKTTLNEELWNAARAGDVARVAKALDAGADVNAGNRYKATALFFAADRGHVEVIKLLLDRGADVNAVDTFYKFRPLMMAAMNDHTAAAKLLLERGAEGAGQVLVQAAAGANRELVDAALKGKALTRAEVQGALAAAKRGKDMEITSALEKALAAFPAEAVVNVPRATLESYAGNYRNEQAPVIVTLTGESLVLRVANQPPLTLVPTSETTFNIVEAPGLSVSFAGRGGTVERLVVTTPQGPQTFARATDGAPGTATSSPAPPAGAPSSVPPPKPAPAKVIVRTAAKPWPAFRGENASGNGDGQGAVTEWSIEKGTNIRWKTPLPGFTTGSPIVWGSRVFVVTAISSSGNNTFRTGLYGDVAPVEDLSEHTWTMYALDKSSGKIVWEKIAFKGAPKVKRHTKSTQANATPVTDGTRVIALFGSIGRLVAWDMDGKELWNVDVGVLDSGWFFDPTYQWGHASSPVIHKDKVIVQADVQKNSFIAAYDVKTGKQIWKTERNEIPSFGTPTIFNDPSGAQIVTNGPTVRGYDVETGKELWRLGPNSELTVGTPVVGDGLVFVTGGYPPVRPIYAIRPTARGDISMPKDKTSSDAIAWSNTAGTYIPTPLYYDGLLYTCDNGGVLTAYEAKTGERVYRARVGGGGSFAASPVAADGKLYFSNEDGDVIVARAGRQYEELAKNSMKEVIMSTPAISDGLIVVRTLGHVYGIGEAK
jgi:Ankyrin repeats (3 copies)/PQQ-like domain